ncbi:hypothetical protein LUZ62_047568 [Rhynchospora pubera]|uniref:BHLH domain-containing protein n=1 Tax=Rhynchospora pubera TaxID=906938 RepID=A0AAV8C8E7_9POAL|nr:hypothetical protein LUZ62_085142 [Rhynchospora pubera]KAJ4796322.1 hypothetical protein LUZ62_047568 [Rhynchospora pubera]
MEHEGTVAEATWGSFDPSVSVEDSEVMAQLLGSQYFSSEVEQRTTMFWPSHDSDSNYDSSSFNNNYSSNYWPQLSTGAGSSFSASSSSLLNSGSSYEGYYLNDPHPMSFIDEGALANSSLEIGLGNNFEKQMISLNHEEPSSEEKAPMNKRRFNSGEDDKNETSTVVSKKKTRSTMPASKRTKNSQSKKAQKKAINSNDEEGDGELNGHTSSSYSSEDDSNESQEVNGGNAGSNSKKTASSGKSRAGRGSATDPQSLYARKRRERINERLRILQNLVPNGTKVDISTMLEEAVQYVKFLQLQIKLLSSDDLWMYAPIAYNGVNIGLDLKISPPQQ